MLKTCEQCGKEFEVNASHYDDAHYCSRNCQGDAYKVRYAGSGNPNFRDAGHHVCKKCGKPFYAKAPNRVYCSPKCYSDDKRKWALGQKRIREYKPKPKKEKAPKVSMGHKLTCLICGQVFYSDNYVRRCAKCFDVKRGGGVDNKCVVCGKIFHWRVAKKTCSEKCLNKWKSIRQKGSKSHLWQGGKTTQAMAMRGSELYAQWRTKVFKRDNYICQLCGSRGKKLAAHHIKRFSDRPDTIYMVANGITLCWSCHGKVNHHEHDYEQRFFAITGGIL